MCSSLRDGIKCKIGGKFNNGTENVVKLIEFNDGVKWVAQVRPEERKPPRNSASVEDQMKSEAATYKYLRCVILWELLQVLDAPIRMLVIRRKYTKLTIPGIITYHTCDTKKLGPPLWSLHISTEL